MERNKRQIIKKKAGELAHLDNHYLLKGIIHTEPKKRYYLYGVIDSTSIGRVNRRYNSINNYVCWT